ncbi:MAG: hypothetical protein JO127_11440 [Caulobacteraceae bacterium]|nr:hypothetical protein [Caulobacteraceae bacterium]
MLKRIFLAGALAAAIAPAMSVAQTSNGYNGDNSYNDNGRSDNDRSDPSDDAYRDNDRSDQNDNAYDNRRDDQYNRGSADEGRYSSDNNRGYYGNSDRDGNPNRYSDQDRGRNPDYGRGYAYHRTFTGRVGASWWDQGRRCQWREVTWSDRDGDPAYKWVTVCGD